MRRHAHPSALNLINIFVGPVRRSQDWMQVKAQIVPRAEVQYK